MIILDPGDIVQQTKDDKYDGLTLRHPQAAFVRSSSPLPDYDASEAQHWRVNSPKEPLIGTTTRKSRFNSRIIRGAFYALCIYAIFSLIAVVVFVVTKNKQKVETSNWNSPPPSLWTVEDKDYNPQLQISNVGPPSTLAANKTCNIWTSTYTSGNSHGATSQFSLPPIGLVSIRSNATYNTYSAYQISGSLSVYTNKDTTQKNIIFSVNVQASSSGLLSRSNICFSPKGPDRGISIYVPANLTKADHLNFNINVIIPQAEFRVNNFVTFLPMLQQKLDKLHEDAYFDHVALEGAVYPITCKYLEAPQISIKNTASSIQGAFNVTSALSLDSIKGSVTSDITLVSPPYIARPVFLSIDTGDSPIYANVSLSSPSKTVSPSSPPGFVARVSNFNAPVHLDVSHKTNTTQAFQLMVINNIAESSVTLDALYSGTFSAKSKMSLVTVSGLGNSTTHKSSFVGNSSRTAIYDQKALDHVAGWVGWGTRPVKSRSSAQSYVDIVSALGPVSLIFG